MRNKTFLKGYLAGVILAAVVAFFLLVDASTTPEFRLDNFTFTDLEGKRITADKLHGRAVIINVWATWCPPCIKEMPSIEHASKLLENENVVFIIASDEPLEKIIRFKEKRNLDLPFFKFSVKVDPSLMSEGRPQTYIFNAKGELVYNRLGAFEWDDSRVLMRLKSYIK